MTYTCYIYLFGDVSCSVAVRAASAEDARLI